MRLEPPDTETGNLVGEYDGVDAAQAVVRDAVRRLGPIAVAPLALATEHDEGGLDDDLPPVLQGEVLVARVHDGPSGQAADAP